MKQSFFRQQENARRRTKQLVVAFHFIVFATALITTLFYIFFIKLHTPMYQDTIINEVLFHKDNFKVFGIVYLMIVGVSWVRSLPLKKGGAYVAKMVGGREISYDAKEPKEKQLINIVEEMGIASGMTLPRVYILDNEESINAFAAGTKINNACVAVSRGSLERLTRDELQGVVAHEFSHILNGDMALNIHLLGYLYGLTSIADAGRIILRSSSRSRRNRNNAAPILGFGLFLIGSLGYFFAFLLKAGISRDRERLADASAVQFTRNPEGIGGALRKIWKENFKVMTSSRSHEISHFYLHWPQPFLSFLSTHPPLFERIKNLGLSTEKISPKHVASNEFNQLEAVSTFAGTNHKVAEVKNPLYVAYAFYLWLEPSPGMGPVDAVMRWNPTFNEKELNHVYELIINVSENERFAILERSVALLRSLESSVIKEMLGQMKALIEEDRRITHREFIFYYYLQLAIQVKSPRKKVVGNIWDSVEIIALFLGPLYSSRGTDEFSQQVFNLLGKKLQKVIPVNFLEVRRAFDVLNFARPMQRQMIYSAFKETINLYPQRAESQMTLKLLSLILEVMD